jgi:hypothetical protein
MSDALAYPSSGSYRIVRKSDSVTTLISGLLYQVLGEQPMDFGKLC